MSQAPTGSSANPAELPNGIPDHRAMPPPAPQVEQVADKGAPATGDQPNLDQPNIDQIMQDLTSAPDGDPLPLEQIQAWFQQQIDMAEAYNQAAEQAEHAAEVERLQREVNRLQHEANPEQAAELERLRREVNRLQQEVNRLTEDNTRLHFQQGVLLMPPINQGIQIPMLEQQLQVVAQQRDVYRARFEASVVRIRNFEQEYRMSRAMRERMVQIIRNLLRQLGEGDDLRGRGGIGMDYYFRRHL
ncbi:hypothetical protein BZA05DRAFT_414630 [Tricharina praecox]|uniref:uncharacterized protein n=1 Tax=Tricharina praecox TaxID=43433 RepID=UPI00222123CC|nr:uncharacterized protein BZA05DRAFT_414630 [Tricharina praecox]KAI5858877.1 hypothetical protein BZA05DRAFT_414630 [Tricharina praecox]